MRAAFKGKRVAAIENILILPFHDYILLIVDVRSRSLDLGGYDGEEDAPLDLFRVDPDARAKAHLTVMLSLRRDLLLPFVFVGGEEERRALVNLHLDVLAAA
jgi:hypothetical protein